MDMEPELPTMTRRRTISPLVAAWAFVLVSFASIILWLSLSAEPPAGRQVAEFPPAAAPASPPSAHMSSDTRADPLTEPLPDGQVVSLAGPDSAPEAAPPAPGSMPEDMTPPDDSAAEPAGDSSGAPEAPTAAFPTRALSLKPAPDPGLVVRGEHGPLPVLGPDGKTAWKEYARPHEDLGVTPKIAILISGIGLNNDRSAATLRDLPGEVSLALSPYARHPQDWADRSRQAGHEIFLMLPTEPLNYPDNDPGPHTLMTSQAARDNLKRLDWLLSRFTGYAGVVNEMGSKFTASEKAVGPVLDDLNRRGLMFLDSRSSRYSVAAQYARSIGMPWAVNTRYLDNVARREDILNRLEELENTATAYGAAVGIGQNYPLTLEVLRDWIQTLPEKGFQLVPVTAVANRQPLR